MVLEGIYHDYYVAIEQYMAKKLSFVWDTAAAVSLIVIATTYVTESQARHGLLSMICAEVSSGTVIL